jgi:hydrogenase maturation protease
VSEARILVAGIGNIFLGDDGFGGEVVHRLLQKSLPEEVRVADFGIRGLDLAYALLDDYEAIILVDATRRGQAPGTIYLLQPDAGQAGDEATQPEPMDMHSLDPVKVLRLARDMGARLRRVLLVGCEPQPFAAEDEQAIGLSEPVGVAVVEAVGLAESIIAELLDRQPAREQSNR